MTQDLAFDLSLTQEQRITRENIQRFSAQRLRPLARDADENRQPPVGFYEQAMELGLTLMALPESLGGAGMARDPVSHVLNLEDLAHGDLSLALGLMTPLSFVNAILDFGDAAQQEAFLAPLAAEHFVPATVALMEGKATFEPSQLATHAVREADGYRINGEKRLVIHGQSAHWLLVIAELEGEGPAAFVVPGDAAGLVCEAQDYMGLRSLDTSRVRLTEVRVPAFNRLDHFDLQRLVDLGRIGVAAAATGCAQAVLDYVTPYVKEREAFGEPIAHRQSVAFMVADMAIEIEGMRLLTWRAASRAAQGLPFHREAYLARIQCAQKAMEIGTNGVQLLGGAGFTREYPVEMWYRNLRAAGILEGVALV